MKSSDPVIDQLNRSVRDLRISVTDRCNFRCAYCMPAEIFGPDFQFLPQDQLLSFEELSRLIRLFTQLGVEKVRITGGEPLLRRDLHLLIQQIRDIDGIHDIALTTNGSLLSKHAYRLKEAGLQRVTVSLDSLDEERFAAMNGTGYPVQSVLEGIEEAQRVGLSVKINMVVQKGKNEQDILPMAKYFREKGCILRFIEYMDVGNSNGWRLDQVVSSKEIVQLIQQEMPLEQVEPNYKGEVATRYRYAGTDEEVGFISSVTQAFCTDCTRVRLSAEGKVYTCLFSSQGYSVRERLRENASDTEIISYLAQIWGNRGDRYSEERSTLASSPKQTKVEMHHIGG